MTAHLCLGCGDDGGCDVCRPRRALPQRCGEAEFVLTVASVVLIVGGCWLVWRAWFA